MDIHWNEKYDSEIRKIVTNFPKNYIRMIQSNGFRGRYENRSYLVEYINSVTPLLQDHFYSLKTKVYWVLNHLTDFPKCCGCGRKLEKWNVVKIQIGYKKFCSRKCQYTSPIWNDLRDEGCIKKYGVKNYFMTDEFKKDMSTRKDEMEEKKYQAKKRNNSFHISEKENEMYQLLLIRYDKNDIERQHKDEKYPFACDFYIRSKDLYLEYNGCWTHNGHPFDRNNEEDLRKLEEWKEKAKTSDFYKMAIYTWSDLDVRKRETARRNNLNVREFWCLNDVREWLEVNDIRISDYSHLNVHWKRKSAKYEFDHFMNSEVGDILKKKPTLNYLIRYFQQDVFYREERKMWGDPDMRRKIIANRMEYLGKSEYELTPTEILEGFESAGFCSHVHSNPFWFRYFVEKNGVKRCYDPCGGLGYHLLGSGKLDHYIYNEENGEIKGNVDNIVSYFGIGNVSTYSNDPSVFSPMEKIDSIFLETGDILEKMWVFDLFEAREDCGVLGIVCPGMDITDSKYSVKCDTISEDRKLYTFIKKGNN